MSFDDARAHAPDETTARRRHDADLTLKKPEFEWSPADILAVAYAASCNDCAFRSNTQCRAYPPRPRLVEGKAVAAWPEIALTDWCGCWRGL